MESKLEIIEFSHDSKRIMKNDFEFISSETNGADNSAATITAADEHKSDHRKSANHTENIAEKLIIKNSRSSEEHDDDDDAVEEKMQRTNHTEEIAEKLIIKNIRSSEGEEEEKDDKVIKEIKKVQRQNFITHCLVSAMIVLTLTWQLSEMTMMLKVKEGLTHPFRAARRFITGWLFKRRNRTLINITDNENQNQGDESTSSSSPLLPIKIPDFPHLELPSIGFTIDEN